MKLRQIELEGLRGAPRPFQVPLKGQTHFIYAENGRGKSTIADALEFLTTGDLADFHREDCGLDAAVNLDTGAARIEADLSEPDGHVERKIESGDASALVCRPADLDLPPIPILRQSTIKAFMQRTSGEKRQALLELLDLDALNDFRNTLRKASGNAKDRRIAAERSLAEEEATLKALLGGTDLETRAAELVAAATLPRTIRSEGDLDSLQLRLPHGEPNREPLLTDLTPAIEALPDDPAAKWNIAVGDASIRGTEALSALLEQGRRLLESDWDADACPLCEAHQDRNSLAAQVRTRVEALAESNRKISTLRQELTDSRTATGTLANAIADVLAVAPENGWPQEIELDNAKKILDKYAADLARAASGFEPCPSFPDLGLDFAELMPKLHVAATPKESPELAALQTLNELQGQRRRVVTRTKAAAAAVAAEGALRRLLEISDEKIKLAVEDALSAVDQLVERYFTQLLADPIYRDVKLLYKARRSGQVEFQIRFGSHTVNPPQRVMSESQLNALGLALLSARVKQAHTPWRSLVLDDVVNSFDASLRTAHDYLAALRSGFREKGSELAKSEVLARIASGDYMTTRVVHTRSGAPEATDGELKRLVTDLRDFDAMLRCKGCEKQVWYAKTDKGHQCECGALKA